MSDRPSIEPGDWICVNDVDCVVANVFAVGAPLGSCEVVFNPAKPTNRNASWTGTQWEFVETGDYGGYADKYPRLRSAVTALKAGRR